MFACIAATSFTCRILSLRRSLRLKHHDFKHSLHDGFLFLGVTCELSDFCYKSQGQQSPVLDTRLSWSIPSWSANDLECQKRATMRFLRTVLCTDRCMTMPQSVACKKKKSHKTRPCSSSRLVWRLLAALYIRGILQTISILTGFVTTAKETWILQCICGIHVDFYNVRHFTFTSCLLLNDCVLIQLQHIIYFSSYGSSCWYPVVWCIHHIAMFCLCWHC